MSPKLLKSRIVLRNPKRRQRPSPEQTDVRHLHLKNYVQRAFRRPRRRVAPRQAPPPRERMNDTRRPLCPRCGERDKVVLPGEAHGSGEVCTEAWCDRCTGYLVSLSPRKGRHVPDF